MLSDDSSTDSESGRFKSHSKAERKETNRDSSRVPRGGERLPDLARNRNSERSFGRDLDRRHEDRGRFGRRRSPDRFHLQQRHSPPRRRCSRDRSPGPKKSPDRSRTPRENAEPSRSRDFRGYKDWRDDKEIKRSDDRDDRHSKRTHDKNLKRSVSPKPQQEGKRNLSPKPQQEGKRNFREEIRKNIIANISVEMSQERHRTEERSRTTRDRHKERSGSHRKDMSWEVPRSSRDTSNRFELHSPIERAHNRNKTRSPIKETSVSASKETTDPKSRRYLEEDVSELQRPASYYNLVPVTANVPTNADVIHSVTDSSEDEEKLRAKLLNLEKELDKSKNKKKSKKSKKKSKSKQRDSDDPVEVSSTTDIQGKVSDNENNLGNMQATEVSSTQQRGRKDSSEEGEISTDDESAQVSIHPTDLRHRLKRSGAVPDTSGSPDLREKLKLRTDAAGSGPATSTDKRARRSQSPEVEGPQLPPHLRRDRNIGPTLPSDMRKVLAEASHDRSVIHYASSEDEGIGPLPDGAEEKWTSAHRKLEERALDMKIRNLEGGSSRSDAKAREEWMLELPEGKAKHLGLGPRQFRTKEAPDMSDRSSWTDTPQQKELKAAGLVPVEEASSATLQRDAHQRYIADRDLHQEKAVKKHKKKHKREESLLDMHQKKLKKKKKKEEKEDGVKVRRPFDRDLDLQVNRFDEAQKNALIKKAQHLDSRFSRGDAKYL